MKTGFTKKSGRCLVSAAERDGVRFVAVTLNAPDDWKDHTAMLDYGFSQYRSLLLADAAAYAVELPVVGGEKTSVMLRNTEAFRVTLPARQITVDTVVELPRFLYATVTAGEAVGCVAFYADLNQDGRKERIGEVTLIADETIPVHSTKPSIWKRITAFFARLFSK